MSELVYVSFLGANNYSEVTYHWDDRTADPTPYAQEAELGLILQRQGIEPTAVKVLIFGTPTSRERHWAKLEPCLVERGFEPSFVEISEDLDPKAQWGTFELLLDKIPPGARLVIDMTHGFRAVPVVFSSALHFLRLVRGVELLHVLYAAFDTTPAKIVDNAEFYDIHDWTEGVSRLVEEANASRLAELAAAGSRLPIDGFEGPELTDALMAVSDAVRNVEVHGIEAKVRDALKQVDRGLERAEARGHRASAILLELVHRKFATLASSPPLSGLYDAPYFELQLRFIELLIEHRLFMQAYTAMIELIGSLGMLGYKPDSLRFTNEKGRKKRRYADIFLRMVGRPREDWRFNGHEDQQKDRLLPYYKLLENAEIIPDLEKIHKDISKIRNGFDHAWTSKQGAPEEIESSAKVHHERLRAIVSRVLDVAPG